MNRFIARTLFAALTMTAMTLSSAADEDSMRTKKLAMEVPVSSITLPLSATSAAVMPACYKCPLKSYPTTATTTYYVNNKPVSLTDLKVFLNSHPNLMLTVMYVVSTGELDSISADIPGGAR